MTTLHLRYQRREGKWADYRSRGERQTFDSLTAARWFAQTLLEDYETITVRIVHQEETVEEWGLRATIE